MTEKIKPLIMESNVVNFYDRLTRVYRAKIDAIDFLNHSAINTAIKTRLLQSLVNQNFVKIRLDASKDPRLLYLSEDSLSACIDDRSLYFYHNAYSYPHRKRLNLKEYLKYWVLWILMLLALFSFWRKPLITPSSPGSILLGCLEGFNNSDEDYQRVDKYLTSSNKSGLSESRYFVLKSDKIIHPLTPNMIGSKFPEATFVHLTKLGFWHRIKTLFVHLYSVIESHLLWIKHPILFEFANEFSSVRVMEILEQQHLLKAYVLSTSNLIQHPLATQLNISAHQHYIYYNIVPTNPVHKNDQAPHIGTLEPFLMMPRQGIHWVWSEEDALFMQSRYHQNNVKVGSVPLLFYPYYDHHDIHSDAHFDIVIFDVIPINLDEHNPNGISYYYGRYETAINLINNTIEAAEAAAAENNIKPLRIALKPKRKNVSHHDMRYWKYIEAIAAKNNNFTILEADQNIFDLFHPETVIINRPFTSTAHLAALKGCKSIYHDPNKEIFDTSVKIKNLIYSSGKADLTELLCYLTKSKATTL